MPKVSVILTSYNHALFLRTAIDSVLNQSFQDFELIILDDGSTDDSWEIIASFSDPRIRAFQSTNPHAITTRLNETIANAAGEYIAIHHSDDAWTTDKLEKQVAYLDQHQDTGAVFTHVQVIDEQGDPFNQLGHPYHQIFDQPNRTRREWLRFFLESGNALCHPSVMMRKSCFLDSGSYRYGMWQMADMDMWVRFCLRYPIHIIQEKLTYFRILDNARNTSSGERREVHVRFRLNLFHMLDNFRNMDVAEFYSIFPELEKVYTGKIIIPQYVWAMLCIEKDFHSVGALYGLNLLFELLQDKKSRELMWQNHQFGNYEFAQLSENDVLLRVTTTELREQLAAKDAELTKVYTSKSWRYTSFLRKLKNICNLR